MNLRERDEPGRCETQGREESAAVLRHPFGRIPRDEAEIQRVPLRRICPAEPGRETVPHTRQFFDGSTTVKGHSPSVSPDKSIRNHDLNSVSRIRSLSIHNAAPSIASNLARWFDHRRRFEENKGTQIGTDERGSRANRCGSVSRYNLRSPV
jgi:hypothetical protein